MLLAAGCGSVDKSPAALFSDDQEAITESVRATVAAIAAQTAAVPANRAAAAPPTIAFVSHVTTVGDSTPSCSVVSGVNLRNGPG